MCQICGIKLAAAQALEASHDEYAKNEAASTNRESIPEALLEILRLLAAAVESLETDRAKWWATPEKRELRRRLEADCGQKPLTELHKINNTTIERIETMQAKLGRFLKWSLGMDGGACGEWKGGGEGEDGALIDASGYHPARSLEDESFCGLCDSKRAREPAGGRPSCE
ncbi:hypothetical protein LTR78_001683 [Recurvomyces mirabilis]|uniref:Uncharacterized protein n=1 Tax=Recurvomyces mirabilis TaxID=574656 RepID=A0AAE0WUE5_9PEZI|nr:hypothetical protein LTR78_001683 [Recurvomyces mirabilis]KAK5151747.1 hypothetical protein LTS14_008879 [Recurvomyces mirabilis]